MTRRIFNRGGLHDYGATTPFTEGSRIVGWMPVLQWVASNVYITRSGGQSRPSVDDWSCMDKKTYDAYLKRLPRYSTSCVSA